MKLKIYEIAGENCITMESGQKVYDQIYGELKAGRPVELDFSSVSIFASPFFNAAIGQLFQDFKPEHLQSLLTTTNLLEPEGLQVLNRVIENSKQYYTDDSYRKAQDEVLGKEAED